VKQHLQAGGSPGGFSFDFKMAPPVDRAETMQPMLAKFGIKAGIQQLAPTAGTSYLYDGDYQAVPSYTPQYSPDPDSIFRPNFHSQGQFNYHRFSNAQLDALIDKAAEETDQEKRKQMYWDAQKLVFDLGIPRIPNVYVDILIPVKNKVKGLTVGWDTYVRVAGTCLEF
jgi:ABC-type transport system substrate-binding protein